MKNLLVRLGPKAPRYYVQIMAFILIVTYMITMAVIFNAICESQSDLLLDPYLNSIGGAPAGSEKGGENQCF